MQITQIPTNNRYVVSGRPIDLVVLHSMEAPEKGDTAEATARYFQNPSVKASAHYNLDNNSVCQGVAEKDVAWAAPGANHDGIQLEHAGYARQTLADWNDKYSRDMLSLSAELSSGIAKRHNIPVTFVRAPGLAAGVRGFTTHAEVSKAFHLSTHTDPGPAFPIQDYLTSVKAFGAPVSPQHTKADTQYPTLQQGSTGWKVRQAQRLLNAAGGHITADGSYGPATVNAVKAFQQRAGLKPTGAIGVATWKALWAARYL